MSGKSKQELDLLQSHPAQSRKSSHHVHHPTSRVPTFATALLAYQWATLHSMLRSGESPSLPSPKGIVAFPIMLR